MTESRSVICNLTRKITSAPEVNFHAPEVELSAQFFSSNYSLQFKIWIHFFKADENEFRGAGNVKRIETSAQITSMKSKSSAAEAIGRTKKKGKKGGKNRKKREKMKIEHRKRQKSAVVVHGSFDISSLRSWQSFIENLVQSQKMDRFSAKLVRRLYLQYLFHQCL